MSSLRFHTRAVGPVRPADPRFWMRVVTATLFVWLLVSMSPAGELGLGGVHADEATNEYESGEVVKVYANKVGPYHNPMETYGFFSMPGCPPVNWNTKFPTFGHALMGDEYYEFNASIRYNTSVDDGITCVFTASEDDVIRLNDMVAERYWYQLTIDGLQVWAALGKAHVNTSSLDENSVALGEATGYVFTHRTFQLHVNGKHIVKVELQTRRLEPLVARRRYTFTYSVVFIPSQLSFDDRVMRSADNPEEFFEHRIRWASVANSFMLVLFLLGIVLLILSRTLRADFAKIDEDCRRREAGHDDLGEEAGWKQLHGDVFRVPPMPSLLCALVGTGVQLCVMTALTVCIGALTAVRATAQQSVVTSVVTIYALSSFCAGYVSASSFQAFAAMSTAIASQWITCTIFTASLFPALLAVCGAVTNIVAILYHSAEAMHITGIIVMFLVWLLISCPLVVVGTLYSRHARRRKAISVRYELPYVNQIPRLIPAPPSRLFKKRYFYPLCGILPFGSIFIELYLVFTSFWLYKLYLLYRFLLLVILAFIMVTACVTVTATYLSLNTENYRWQWTSFMCGASPALYVLAYAVYFYTWKTSMSGLFMFVFYFTYMSVLCALVALIGGAVGFLSVSVFVRHIYGRVKSD